MLQQSSNQVMRFDNLHQSRSTPPKDGTSGMCDPTYVDGSPQQDPMPNEDVIMPKEKDTTPKA